MEPRIRKTINVSLQSKKYCTPMNELINEWEEDGLNLSIKVCEQLLKLNKLEKSATFIKVLNLFELAEKMAMVYNLEDESKIEEILSKVIQVDTTGLSEIFMTINQVQDSNGFQVDSTSQHVESTSIVKETQDLNNSKNEQKYEITDDQNYAINQDDNILNESLDEVPMDFLFNS